MGLAGTQKIGFALITAREGREMAPELTLHKADVWKGDSTHRHPSPISANSSLFHPLGNSYVPSGVTTPGQPGAWCRLQDAPWLADS